MTRSALVVVAVAALVGVLCTVPSAEGVVVGIDFGSEWIKVSLVKAGAPLEVVTNEQSKRKTAAVLGVFRDDRFFGDGAVNLAARTPQTMITHLKDVLGVAVESDVMEQVKGDIFLPYEWVPTEGDRGTVAVHLKRENVTFLVEELVAMLLDHARDQAEAYAGTTLKDVVITVPPYFDQSRRQAMLDSAKIAGLNVLSLMNDNTAVALQHALGRSFDEGDTNVIFYDLGAQSLSVSLVKYSKETDKKNKTAPHVQVLASAWDITLGGHQIESRLALKWADEFQAKIPSDAPAIRDTPRTMSKLLKEARRIKEVLSANTETIVVIESLHHDLDFKATISRQELEDMCQDLAERAVAPVKKVLADAGLEPTDISFIELFGGGTRVPFLQSALESVGIPLGRHLNSDEAAVLGAAFRGATLSTAFRVKEFVVRDGSPWGYGVVTLDQTDGEVSKETAVYLPMHKFDSKKVVSFYRTQNFTLQVFYNMTDVPREDSTFLQVRVEGVDAALEKFIDTDAKTKVSIGFHLTESGILDITKADAVIEETIEPEEESSDSSDSTEDKADADKPEADKEEADKEKADKDEADKDEADKEEADKEEADKEEADKEEADKEEADKEEADKEEADKEEADKEEADKEEADKEAADKETDKEAAEKEAAEKSSPKDKPKKRTQRIPLRFTVEHLKIPPMTDKEVKTSSKVLRDLDHKDLVKARNAEAKNTLEGFIYSTKDKIQYTDGIDKVSTEEQRSELLEKLDEAESWLYEEGDDTDAATYWNKHDSLNSLSSPIMTRFRELEARPKAVKDARSSIAMTRKLLEKLTSMNDTAVTEQESESLKTKMDDLEAWLDEMEKTQGELERHEDPAFLSDDVEAKRTAIERQAAILARKPPKPKPKPKKEKKEDKKKDDEKSTVEPSDDDQEKPPTIDPVDSDDANTDASTSSDAANDDNVGDDGSAEASFEEDSTQGEVGDDASDDSDNVESDSQDSDDDVHDEL